MKSIFSSVFTYSPRAARSPEEDFFTEVFAGVLRASLPLRTGFVEDLICYDVDSVHVDTQKTVDSRDRIDIWIEARNQRTGARHVIAMENKIRAAEGQNQLLRYEAHLRRDTSAATRTLVYATLHERRAYSARRGGPEVAFKSIHWFEVAEWMRKWTAKHRESVDERSIVLIRELLLLMEDWNMAINLDAGNLATATAYRTSVEAQLLQILEETKGACDLAGTPGNAWSHDRRNLVFSSPWVDEQQDVAVEFGFDFERDDADWSVAQLSLPSVYFAVSGADRPEIKNLQNWEPPPEAWGSNYLRVKQLGNLQVHGNSLHAGYLNFFLTAREELWQVLGLE